MTMRERAIKRDSKFTTSKVWLMITCFIFISTLISVFILMNLKQDILDTSIYVTMIAVTGGIFGSNLVWYSKKSASENHYKLRASMYHDTVSERLYYNEEMMKLMQKYSMTEEDIEKINSTGEIDEIMDSEIQSAKDKMDSDRDDCESPNELHTFN